MDALEAADFDRAHAVLLDLPPPRPAPVTLLAAEIELARGDEPWLTTARDRLLGLQAEPLEPEDAAWSAVLLGATLSCQGEDAAARPWFERALAHDRAWLHGEYGAAYAACLIELDAFAAADPIIEGLREVDVAARTIRARWLRRQHRPAEALRALRPDDGPAYDAGIAFEAACIHRALGADAEADAWCARGRALRPDWFARAVRMEPERFRP